MHRQAPCAMLMMRRLAQLLAAVELMRTCIAPVDTVRREGRADRATRACGHRRRVRSNGATQPCCVEAVSRVRKMNSFSLSARKTLLPLSFGLRMSPYCGVRSPALLERAPAGFSTMINVP